MEVREDVLKVLLIEDDATLADQIARYFERHAIHAMVASDGVTGQAEALRTGYDCIVLDLTLPRRDGLEVCRQLRERSEVPIIIVTARDEEADRVLGLELGADDYVLKPFSSRELVARIRSNVRRSRVGGGHPISGAIRIGSVRIDPVMRSVEINGEPIDLTTSEFAILSALADRANQVISRKELVDLAHLEDSDERAVDVHISRLRGKLGDAGRIQLKTVRGRGYVLAGEAR